MEKLFTDPAYVYVYVDKNTGKPVYVGKVNAGSSLDSRINDHKYDHWYDKHNQIIYYTPVESSATADILETTMINDFLAKEYPLNNIAKTKWGRTSLVSKDQFGWIQYIENNQRIININKRILEELESIILLKEQELSELKFELEMMSDPNYDFLLQDDDFPETEENS